MFLTWLSFSSVTFATCFVENQLIITSFETDGQQIQMENYKITTLRQTLTSTQFTLFIIYLKK